MRILLVFMLAGILNGAVFAQKKVKPEIRVKLIERTVVCKSCELFKPRFTKEIAQDTIAQDETLFKAVNKISPYFQHVGDKFVLSCESCSDGPSAGFLVLSDGNGGTVGNAFGTKLYATKTARPKKKGAEKFYELNQLFTFLTDSILVFDSVQISVSEITNASARVFSTLRAKYIFNDNPIERIIPYDPVKKLLTISNKTIFGNKLPREITDTIPVSLYYIDDDGTPVTVDGTYKLFFATEKEQKAVAEMYETYLVAFPDWTREAVAIELAVPVISTYKNISLNNFIDWLGHIKPH